MKIGSQSSDGSASKTTAQLTELKRKYIIIVNLTIEVNDTVEELVGEERMRQFSEECFQQNCSNVHILQQNKKVISASYYAMKGSLAHLFKQ